MITKINVSKLFMLIIFSILAINNNICMNTVNCMPSNNNPEPEVVVLKRLGLTMGSIRTLKQNDYEVAQNLHVLLNKISARNIEHIKVALEDFDNICKQVGVRLKPYLQDILKSLSENKKAVEQEDILLEIKNEKLINIDKIQDLLKQYLR